MVEVDVRRVLYAEEATAAWTLYRNVFDHVNEEAAQRHLMTFEEYAEVVADNEVEKYLAWHSGRLVGVSTITPAMSHWPLVSPRYFEKHWPGRRWWYVGFVGTNSVGRKYGAFKDLLATMTAGRREDGLFFMDFCQYNLNRGIVKHCAEVLEEIDDRVKMQRVDVQEFWLTTFGAQP
jgi:hypothetical protein